VIVERCFPTGMLGHYARLLAGAGLVSVLTATSPPYPVRNPQVPVNGSELQNYLNGLGESINVFTDQLNAQTYIPSVSGNSAMTLMIELARVSRAIRSGS